MRIVIDIEGDQIEVHRRDGDELPPAEVLKKAAAMNARSAGIATIRRPDFVGDAAVVVSPEDLSVAPIDAGRAPSGRSKGRPAPRAAAGKPRPSRRTVAKRGRGGRPASEGAAGSS